MNSISKLILTLSLVLVFFGFALIYTSVNLGKLRIVACDVGQGDGFLIITPSGKQILVDSGPGKKILDCLGAKMPFWDRKVELIMPSHSQKDHIEGFLEVFKQYKVDSVVGGNVESSSKFYGEYKDLLAKDGSSVHIAKSGDKIILDNKDSRELYIEVLWPHELQIDQWKERPPADANETSVVFKLNYGDFCAYFTGDVPLEILENIVSEKCQVLKIAHHGSKTGTNQKIIDIVSPKIAFISAGRGNSYGHPHKEVLDLLSGVSVLRTDKSGDFEIQTDGVNLKIDED